MTDNPSDRVEPPKMAHTRNKLKYFTLEQTERFLSILDKDYTTTYKPHDRIDDTGKSYHVAEYNEKRCLPLQFGLFYQMALFCGMH